MPQAFDLKKILWSCRRGMLELDVVLIPFAEQHFESLDDHQKKVFVELLEQPDPDLYTWLMGYGQTDDKHWQVLIEYIRNVMKIA